MSQSLAQIFIHIIFSTKGRRALISKSFSKDLYNYMTGISRNLNCPVHEIGGVEDHIHILVSLSRTLTISQLIEEIKKSSSKWVKSKDPAYWDFAWQAGYGAFSVSQSGCDEVRRYIRNQESHHAKISFQDEFIYYLKKYQIDYDEKYIWD